MCYKNAPETLKSYPHSPGNAPLHLPNTPLDAYAMRGADECIHEKHKVQGALIFIDDA
jgi:hypothetical protein